MRITSRTIGSTSIALLLIAFSAGCSTPAPQSASTSATTTTPTAEAPTPTTADADPDAACLALLDDATIADFDAKGWAYDADFQASEVADPSIWQDYVTDPQTCRYGGEFDDGVIYGIAEITDDKADALKAELKKSLGTIDISDDGSTYTAVDSYTARVRFGDGVAAYSVGEPDIIDLIAANSGRF